MVHGKETYCIARVYQATHDGAKVRFSQELRAYGQSIIDAFATLPVGVTPDGVSIVPHETMFGNEITLSATSEEED